MSTPQRTLDGLDIIIFGIVPLRSASKAARAGFESEVGTADITEEELPYTLDFPDIFLTALSAVRIAARA